VLIVDDDRLMRAGLVELLGADPTIEVVGEASTGREAIERVADVAPDVVLMDVRMPDLDGIAATAALARVAPLAKVVILTTFDQDDYLFDALRAGASGFLLKRCRPEELIAAVHIVAAGDALLSPTVTRRVIDRMAQPTAPPPGDAASVRLLTARERDVLHALGRGLSNREIATSLYIEESTVRTHVKRILMKLNLRDRIQAVIYVYENGISRPGDAAGPAPRSR
jgi:DNA-binding NarL/FixJ family response regulator